MMMNYIKKDLSCSNHACDTTITIICKYHVKLLKSSVQFCYLRRQRTNQKACPLTHFCLQHNQLKCYAACLLWVFRWKTLVGTQTWNIKLLLGVEYGFCFCQIVNQAPGTCTFFSMSISINYVLVQQLLHVVKLNICAHLRGVGRPWFYFS